MNLDVKAALTCLPRNRMALPPCLEHWQPFCACCVFPPNLKNATIYLLQAALICLPLSWMSLPPCLEHWHPFCAGYVLHPQAEICCLNSVGSAVLFALIGWPCHFAWSTGIRSVHAASSTPNLNNATIYLLQAALICLPHSGMTLPPCLERWQLDDVLLLVSTQWLVWGIACCWR